MELKDRTGNIIFEAPAESIKELLLLAVSAGADFHRADLQEANLRGADFRGADFRGADLYGADLRRANLRGADLDFSCLPLSCKGTNIKAGDRLFSQLVYHLTRQDWTLSKDKKAWLASIPSDILNGFLKYRDDLKKM